jgi:hypothetical protein
MCVCVCVCLCGAFHHTAVGATWFGGRVLRRALVPPASFSASPPYDRRPRHAPPSPPPAGLGYTKKGFTDQGVGLLTQARRPRGGARGAPIGARVGRGQGPGARPGRAAACSRAGRCAGWWAARWVPIRPHSDSRAELHQWQRRPVAAGAASRLGAGPLPLRRHAACRAPHPPTASNRFNRRAPPGQPPGPLHADAHAGAQARGVQGARRQRRLGDAPHHQDQGGAWAGAGAGGVFLRLRGRGGVPAARADTHIRTHTHTHAPANAHTHAHTLPLTYASPPPPGRALLLQGLEGGVLPAQQAGQRVLRLRAAAQARGCGV